MEGIQYKLLIIKLVDKQRFITENPCVTGSIPVGTTKKGLVKTSLFCIGTLLMTDTLGDIQNIEEQAKTSRRE